MIVILTNLMITYTQGELQKLVKED